MTRMTGGEALVEMLRRHGVDTIFALPGVQNDALFVAFYDAGDSLRVIHTRHEQGAAYMAFGYARASGKVGAYAVVPGPGLLNTTAALATAYATNAPVLCISGQILRPDRPGLWPAARDPRPARHPAGIDQMGGADRPPDRDRQTASTRRSDNCATAGRVRSASRCRPMSWRSRPRWRCPAGAARAPTRPIRS